MGRFSIPLFLSLFSLLWTPSMGPSQIFPTGVQKFRVAVKAPDFALEELGGGKITLAEFKGKVVILNFFTTG